MSKTKESKFVNNPTSIFAGTETTMEAKVSCRILGASIKLLSRGIKEAAKPGAPTSLSDTLIQRVWAQATKKISRKSSGTQS